MPFDECCFVINCLFLKTFFLKERINDLKEEVNALKEEVNALKEQVNAFILHWLEKEVLFIKIIRDMLN